LQVQSNRDALLEFLAERGGRIGAAADFIQVAQLQAQAASLGRALAAPDASIASSALQEGLTLLTKDIQFYRFLRARCLRIGAVSSMIQVTHLFDLYRDFTKKILSSGQSASDEDVLAWMVLLHTHTIALFDPIISEHNGITNLPPVTKRTAADVVASLWSDQMDTDRSNYQYWYGRYETETPFELIEQVTPDYVTKVTRMKRQLMSDPRVRSVVPEV
jgi:hypothetical protein